MEIYHYSPETGEFIGEGVADPCPVEEGKFLLPAFSTETKPPEEVVGKIRAYANGTWTYEDVPEPEPVSVAEEPSFVPLLDRYQFWTILRMVGVGKEDVADAIKAQPEVEDSEYDLIELFESLYFKRDSHIVEVAIEKSGIVRSEFYSLWDWAAGV